MSCVDCGRPNGGPLCPACTRTALQMGHTAAQRLTMLGHAPAAEPEPLFPGHDQTIVPPPGPGPSERRRARQALSIANGRHPLDLVVPGIMLHPDAPTSTPAGTTTVPFTCGSCAHRVKQGGTAGSYTKCGLPGRSTRGEATDLRTWWPACVDYEAPQ